MAWATLGQLGGIGAVERLARQLGLRRLSGRPLTRGVWTGTWRERPLALRASRESAPSLAWRAELGPISSDLPRFHREAEDRNEAPLPPAAAAVPQELLALLRPGERLGGGPDGLRCSGHRPPSRARLEALLAALVAFEGELITVPLPDLIALRWATRSDSSARVRLARACLTAFPHSETARHLREDALGDHDWSMRLVARTAGLPALEAVEGAFDIASCAGAPIAVRVDALRHLVPPGELGPEARIRALEGLRSAQDFPEAILRATALETGASLGRFAFGLLADGVEDTSTTVRIAGLRALGAVGGAISEQAVLHLLESSELMSETAVSAAALEVLGDVGSLQAVPWLDAALGDLGMGDARSEAILGALRRIRKRHPATGPRGALALTSGLGQLSDP
ncbi:MAG: hypothetical protein AAFZ18_21890 [Myxococcota bacterium]